MANPIFSKRAFFIVLLLAIIGYLLRVRVAEWSFNSTLLDLFPDLNEIGFFSSSDMPAKELMEKGAKPKHPVILIPGIISSSLELWAGRDCSMSFLRQRIWGSVTMLRFMLVDPKCWFEHLKLKNGSDPDDIRLRPSSGLDAADYVLPGYWVWGRIIENMALFGYDPSNLYMAAYDWRLGFDKQEERDFYFTKLKASIELAYTLTNQKVVIISHSMGSLLFHYFMNWIKSKNGKNEPDWCSKYIHSYVNIAGPLLGAPKTVSTVVSGEARETVQLGTVEAYIMNYFFSLKERTNLFRTWGGLMSLLPKGGSAIWGNHNLIELEWDTTHNQKKEFTMDDTHKALEFFLPSESFSLASKYSLSSEIDSDDPSKWSNPLESSLPHAPDMKIYCLYGLGLQTEIGYKYRMDQDYRVKEFVHADGDGSVPEISLGYMCKEGWKSNELNPSQIKVTTREYLHSPTSKVRDIRGGPDTGDHVDILGNRKLILDLLTIVSDFEQLENSLLADSNSD